MNLLSTSRCVIAAALAGLACGNKSRTEASPAPTPIDFGGGALVVVGYPADEPHDQGLIDTNAPSSDRAAPFPSSKGDPIQMFDVVTHRLTTLGGASRSTMSVAGTIRASVLVMTAGEGLLAIDTKHGAKTFHLSNPVPLTNGHYSPYVVDRDGARFAHVCETGNGICIDSVRIDKPFLDSANALPTSTGTPTTIPSLFDVVELVQWTDDGHLLVSENAFGAFSPGSYSDNKSTARVALVDPSGKTAPLVATVEAAQGADRMVFSGSNELAWIEREQPDLALVVAPIDHPADRHRYKLGAGDVASCIFVRRTAFACNVSSLDGFRLVSLSRADGKLRVLDPDLGTWVPPVASPDGHWLAYIEEDAQKRAHLRITAIGDAHPVAPLSNDPPIRAVLAWLEAR